LDADLLSVRVGGGGFEGDWGLKFAVTPKSQNLGTVERRVFPRDRADVNGHRGGILWFTGLSGAGKSTLAVELERRLFHAGFQVTLLDGDNVRKGLSSDLGFSPEDRTENIRRIGEVAGLFAEAGMIVISAFISPYRADRDRVRAAHSEYFHEVYINAPLHVCEARDAKGLYRRARAGEIKGFTGISAPYEAPSSPDLEIKSGKWSLERCLAQLESYVQLKLSNGKSTKVVEAR
jgi:bifunctional enzyme CysN/CysC